MLISKYAKVKWNAFNKNYYVSKGYVFTRMRNIFDVKIEDLQLKSNSFIEMKCDYCGVLVTKRYSTYINCRKHTQKDCCDNVNCMKQKREETMLLKYNVKNAAHVKELQEKKEETNVKKYGHKTALLNKDVRNKTQKTIIKIYGVTHISKSETIKNKKCETSLRKYGVKHTLQSKEVLEKSRQSMYKNGTQKCSKQQKYLHNLLGGGLNYPVNTLSLDIAFIEDMIYLEYDGSGHKLNIKFGLYTEKEFEHRERKRKYFLKNKGWKVIIINSIKDFLPSDKIILALIHIAKEYLNSGHSWFEINIDKGKIKCSQYEKDYDFGQLRKITQDDLESA
jgi:hypothetical protein